MALMFKNKQKFNYCWYYVDDLIWCNRTFEEHLEHLRNIFATIKTNNLCINPTKTMLVFRKVKFLGHQMTSQGIKILPKKVKVIQNITPPKNRVCNVFWDFYYISENVYQITVSVQPQCDSY